MGLSDGPALVLGGTGLVGTALVARLRAAGVEVHAAGREVDVGDAAAVDAAVAGCSAVFHVAGPAADDPGADPVAVLDAALMGTLAVLEACRRHDVARVVVAGSLAAYRDDVAGAIAEDAPLGGRTPYGAAKACADLAARAYAASFGLPVVVARLANVYGPGDRHATRLVPELVAALRSARAPRLRSDGTASLDLLHAEDAATALVALADLAGGAARGLAVNVGSGRAHTVREVAEAAGVEPVYGDAPGGAARWLAIARLHDLTGWAPAHDLRSGLASTLRG